MLHVIAHVFACTSRCSMRDAALRTVVMARASLGCRVVGVCALICEKFAGARSHTQTQHNITRWLLWCGVLVCAQRHVCTTACYSPQNIIYYIRSKCSATESAAPKFELLEVKRLFLHFLSCVVRTFSRLVENARCVVHTSHHR